MARPYVILNAAMTLDGKIATVAGDSKISCKRDLNRVHGLRASVDAVIVGAGTVLADNPLLTVRRAKGKNPVRVIVDGEARTPVDARVLDDSAKTIIAVSKRAPKRKLKELRAAGAEVIVIGNRKVNLRRLLKRLHSLRVRRLLLEGGSTINWGMLKQGLVDEVRVAVAPRIVGGAKSKSLVGGAGFAEVRNGIKLKLLNVKKIEKHILLTYRVWGAKGAKKAR